MNSTTISITEPQTLQEFEAYYLLRYEILRKPWNQSQGSEKDDMENECFHAMLCDENKVVKGVGRIQFNTSEEAQLRYMAIADDSQKKGFGKKLVEYLENKAKEKGAKTIILQSRSEAVDFYNKCGYMKIKETFLLFNEIQHYLMSKELTNNN